MMDITAGNKPDPRESNRNWTLVGVLGLVVTIVGAGVIGILELPRLLDKNEDKVETLEKVETPEPDPREVLESKKAKHQLYPGASEAMVKAQLLSQVDFTNDLSAKAAPRIMKSASPNERVVLVSKLKEADTKAAALALKEIILTLPKSPNPVEDLRAHAIAALAQMECPEAWQCILELVESDEDRIRIWIATSLGYTPSERSRGLLNTLLDDPSSEVRGKARGSLVKISKAKSE